MNVQIHARPQDFLTKTLHALRENPAANNLMLGISLRLEKDELANGHKVFMGTIEKDGVLVAAGLMTPPYNLVAFCNQDDCTDSWRLLVNALQAQGWHVPGVIGQSNHARTFAENWQQVTGEAYTIVENLRAFELRAVTPTQPTPGRMRAAQMDDLQLVVDWWHDFVDEALRGDEPHMTEEQISERIQTGSIYLWDYLGAVSFAGTTRPIGQGISIGPVYTPPEERRKGYASAVVAALSQLMLDSGYEYCTLFTDLTNPTSNAIYRRIGYRPVCDYLMLRFRQGSE